MDDHAARVDAQVPGQPLHLCRQVRHRGRNRVRVVPGLPIRPRLLLKARQATDNLADLIESTVDLQGRSLASQLDENLTGPLTPAIGQVLTRRMRKSRWEPGSPTAD